MLRRPLVLLVTLLLAVVLTSAALAANVRRLFDDPAAAEKIGAAARATVESEASIGAFATRLEATCRRVVEGRAR